uniref:Uncharacterized protein n=1 Tax=Arundo donax TaxID=35708 RepID=A0A0A9FU61_ARUDO
MLAAICALFLLKHTWLLPIAFMSTFAFHHGTYTKAICILCWLLSAPCC